MKKIVFLLILDLLANIGLFAQFGPLTPDSTFNSTSTLVRNSFETKKVFVMDDGRILCAGSLQFFLFPELNKDFSICCLLPNGSIDSTFGDNGFITIDNGNVDEEFWELEKLNNGFLAVGVFNTETGSWPFKRIAGDCFMLKFDNLGNVDLAFGNNGSQIISTNPVFTIQDIKISDNNDIYLLTDQQEYCGYDYRGKIIKMNQQGNIDLSFGQQGYLEFPLYLPQSMNLLLDGGFAIIGTDTSQQLDSPFNFLGTSCWQAAHICKLNSNGTLDINFGINGKKLLSTNGLGIVFRSSLATGDGFYIMGDEGYAGTRQNLYKLNNEGEFDSTFSDDGKVRVTVQDSYGSWNIYHQTMVQHNNSLWLLGGIEIRNMNCQMKSIIKFSLEGIQDSTLGFFPFSAEPVFTEELADSIYYGIIYPFISCSETSRWFDMAFQQDGKIIVSGEAYSNDTSSATIPNGFIVSRLIPSTELNPLKIIETSKSFVEIFPNPSNSKVYIRLANHEKVVIVIYNLLGEIVKQQTQENPQVLIELDISEFKSGLYFINIVGKDLITSKKIIKG